MLRTVCRRASDCDFELGRTRVFTASPSTSGWQSTPPSDAVNVYVPGEVEALKVSSYQLSSSSKEIVPARVYNPREVAADTVVFSSVLADRRPRTASDGVATGDGDAADARLDARDLAR